MKALACSLLAASLLTGAGCSSGTGKATSTGPLTPPFCYTLDPVADVPTTVPAGVGKM